MDIVTIAVPHFDEVLYILCDDVDTALRSYGAALTTYYNSVEQAEELVNLGRIKILSAFPRSQTGSPASGFTREEHVTWTYSDLRAKPFECLPRTTEDISDLAGPVYFFDIDGWVFNDGRGDGTFVPVAAHLVRERLKA